MNHEVMVGFTYGFFGFLTFWLCWKGGRAYWIGFNHRVNRMGEDLGLLQRDLQHLKNDFEHLKRDR